MDLLELRRLAMADPEKYGRPYLLGLNRVGKLEDFKNEYLKDSENEALTYLWALGKSLFERVSESAPWFVYEGARYEVKQVGVVSRIYPISDDIGWITNEDMDELNSVLAAPLSHNLSTELGNIVKVTTEDDLDFFVIMNPDIIESRAEPKKFIIQVKGAIDAKNKNTVVAISPKRREMSSYDDNIYNSMANAFRDLRNSAPGFYQIFINWVFRDDNIAPPVIFGPYKSLKDLGSINFNNLRGDLNKSGQEQVNTSLVELYLKSNIRKARSVCQDGYNSAFIQSLEEVLYPGFMGSEDTVGYPVSEFDEMTSGPARVEDDIEEGCVYILPAWYFGGTSVI